MDEKGDLFTNSHRILARWRNHFSQLLDVRGVNDVRQTEIHTAEPLVPQPSVFEDELAIEKLRSYTLPDNDQIPATLIKVGGRKICYEIHKLIFFVFGIRRNCLRSGRSPSSYLSIRQAKQQIEVTVDAYHFCQLHTKFYPLFCSQG
jgi:hypothetical protein